MDNDVTDFLKRAGYLDSPASRFFWKNATPTLRGHLRHLLLVFLSAGIPAALLFTGMSRLAGWDRSILFGFYLVLALVVQMLLEGIVVLCLRLPSLPEQLGRGGWVFGFTVVTAALFLVTVGSYLQVHFRAFSYQVVIWPIVAIIGWLCAKGIVLLIISRLYWRGMKPPPRRPHPLLALIVLSVVLAVQLWLGARFKPATRALRPNPPMLLLAMDLPESLFETYQDMFPKWVHQSFNLETENISDFWTSIGTGTPTAYHQSSLVAYGLPLFSDRLVQEDPTQRIPIALFTLLGLSEPGARSGRYRKYFWEILDERGARVYSLGYWHSFPANSFNGGTLSERWSLQNQDFPYELGLPNGMPSQVFDVTGDRVVDTGVARENRIWAVLESLAEGQNFDVAVAYLPLADWLDHLEPDTARAKQAELTGFRRERIAQLLHRLPAETNVGILFATGKHLKDQQRVRVALLSNWSDEILSPFQTPLEIAPTVLNLYDLPSGRHMAASRAKNGSALNKSVMDYGKPVKIDEPLSSKDNDYYQVLKSLGYVK